MASDFDDGLIEVHEHSFDIERATGAAAYNCGKDLDVPVGREGYRILEWSKLYTEGNQVLKPNFNFRNQYHNPVGLHFRQDCHKPADSDPTYPICAHQSFTSAKFGAG